MMIFYSNEKGRGAMKSFGFFGHTEKVEHKNGKNKENRETTVLHSLKNEAVTLCNATET